MKINWEIISKADRESIQKKKNNSTQSINHVVYEILVKSCDKVDKNGTKYSRMDQVKFVEDTL